MAEVYQNEWTYQDGGELSSTTMTCTPNASTATALAFHAEALTEMAPTDLLMAALTTGDVLRVKTTTTTTVWDYTVGGPPVLTDDVWTVPIVARTGGGALIPGNTCPVMFLLLTNDLPEPAPPSGEKAWPTVGDCVDRLGVDPSDQSQVDALTAALDATVAMVLRSRSDLLDDQGVPVPTIEADDWQGIVILACLDYRAANSPNGFTGYDGGLPGDAAERFRAQQLLRVARWVVPRVG